MKDFVRKPLNIVALLLMAIDFFVIMYCGYALADGYVSDIQGGYSF